MRLSSIAACCGALLVVACGPAADPGAGDDQAGDDDQAMVDEDGDGFSPLGGDCDDHDDNVYPGAPELADGLDNDCNTLVDDDLPTVDDDGDGYSNVEGDCDDGEPLVNPGAVEVNETVDEDGNIVPEGVDNDCDGQVDEGVEPCDGAIGGANARDFASSMELCEYLVDARWQPGIPAVQHAIKTHFGGVYVPHAGYAMGVISSGRAVDASDPQWENPSPGATVSGVVLPHPDPHGDDPNNSCDAADPDTVQDYVGLTLQIQVPTNAQAMMFDFSFMSAEFPSFVCSDYDDTFLAMLDSSTFHGNVSFDDQGRPVTINSGFFDVCQVGEGADCTGNAELAGTGFESYGGTGWLHTIAPVMPGETITLTFHLFDEGDTIWDSLVLLDNFQWLGVPVDGPITVDREVADEVDAMIEAGASIDEVRARF
jgi:hypothetical protein